MAINKRGYEARNYRAQMDNVRFNNFTIGYKDSDLWIGIDRGSFTNEIPIFALTELKILRQQLEKYILAQPEFASSFVPIEVANNAPKIAIEMAKAAELAGTGPMAAVAGAFAEHLGRSILNRFPIREVIVENGGDIFVSIISDLLISVHAGNSAFTNKIGVEIPAKDSPLGICTSAGTVGHSISFGNADAVMVVSKNCAVADAFATAIGNNIKQGEDIELQMKKQKNNLLVDFLLVIYKERIGVQGKYSIKPLKG